MLDEVADSAMLLADRPATPMVRAPYKLILLLPSGRGGRSALAAFGSGPVLGAQVQNLSSMLSW
jgi:hypothetical protein